MGLSENIKYVGVDDLDIDLFEGQYVVPEGVTYNSYVILDEKTAVMDTVDARKAEQWLNNVQNVLCGVIPDYLVLQHIEPDHAGCVKVIMDHMPNTKIVCSVAAQKMLAQFFDGESFLQNVVTVKEGDSLSLGKHTLNFYMAPMVHWPEVMVTYESSEKVLFSADGFGKFGAACHEDGDWACEARRYYFNICGKYGVQVQALLKKAAALDIQTICPLHGPVLTENLSYYIGLYDTWSKYEPENEGVLVAYASFHGNTEAAALKLADILKQKGAKKVAVADLARADMAEVIEDAFRYNAMVLAAPTYDGGMATTMVDFLHHLKIKNFQNRKVGFIENGSWAPMAGKLMRAAADEMKNMQTVEPVVTIKSTMKAADVKALEALADAILSK